MVEGITELDDRYRIVTAGHLILLFDSQEKRSVTLTPELAGILVRVAGLGRELAGLGAGVTVTLTQTLAQAEIQLRFEPAAGLASELDDG